MFFLTDTKTDDDIVTCIKRTNDIIDASPLKDHAFVYSDIYTYWSSFIGIDAVLWKALGITVAVMLVSALLLLQSPTSALIVAAMSMIIVVQMYGICMTFLKFNTFVVSGVLAGAGLSIEFTAHIASSFVLAKGTPEQRLARMMKDTYPAILQGAASSLLGIFPLVFSRIPFARQYIFMPFAVLIAVGLFDGVILLPGLLALSARLQASTPQEEEETGGTGVKAEDTSLPTILAAVDGDGKEQGSKYDVQV
mmetsp:Transcript_6160/g.19738  ORF Transcript_6160/g.19738 Transcript_6160/m.19738 type:complete len:251 (+) Transcript_6160:62-814(+)